MQPQTEHHVPVKGGLPCNDRQKKKATNSDSFSSFHQRNENILCHLNQNGETSRQLKKNYGILPVFPFQRPSYNMCLEGGYLRFL